MARKRGFKKRLAHERRRNSVFKAGMPIRSGKPSKAVGLETCANHINTSETRTRITLNGTDTLVSQYHGIEVPKKQAYSLYNSAGRRRTG